MYSQAYNKASGTKQVIFLSFDAHLRGAYSIAFAGFSQIPEILNRSFRKQLVIAGVGAFSPEINLYHVIIFIQLKVMARSKVLHHAHVETSICTKLRPQCPCTILDASCS